MTLSKLINTIVIFALGLTLLPFVGRFADLPELLLLSLSTLLILITSFRQQDTLHIICLGSYALVLLFNALSGDEIFTLSRILLEFVSVALPVSLLSHFRAHEDLCHFSLRAYGFILLCSAAISLPVLVDNPLILRLLFSSQDAFVGNHPLALWVSDYGKAHISIVFLPLLICLLKSGSLTKVQGLFILMSLVVMTLFVMLSSATTAALLGGVGILVAGSISPKHSTLQKAMRLSTLACLSLIIINPASVLSAIEFVTPFFDGSTTAQKLQLLSSYFETGNLEGGLAKRDSYHDLSLKGFLSSPFFGVNDGNLFGRHSFFLDRICMLGLIGFLPVAVIIFRVHAKALREVKDSKFYNFVSLTLCLVLFASKNAFSFDFFLVLLCLLPLGYQTTSKLL